MRARKQPWQKLQDLVVRDVAGSDTIGSGRIPPYKYDVTDQTKQLHIECKCYSSNNGRILKKWIEKLYNECARSTTKYPVIVIANPADITKYITCVDSSIAEDLKIPHLFGYPKVTEAVGISLEASDRSFRIKEPGSLHFFNIIKVPLKHRIIELIIFDRLHFIELWKRLKEL